MNMEDAEEPPIQTILSWVYSASVVENEVDDIFMIISK